MDNYHQGDLTDIFRATLAGVTSSSSSSTYDQLPAPPDLSSTHTWHPHNHHFSFSDATANDVVVDPRGNPFGDPFSNMRDPFLHDLDLSAVNSSSYFSANNGSNNSAIEEVTGFAGSSAVLGQNLLEDRDMRIIRPPVAGGGNGSNSMFSSMIQISPGNIHAVSPPCDSVSPVNLSASPRGIRPPAPASSAVVSGNMVDNAGGVQISSPRNPGLKRRKSQAKKVVCIPAPAAANSRPSSGEVVPSDLWAWRKYGQKPIKGSPYPRGYYRCSSSKGCSARKQVERSRTDPNMLVITYTSEHNHPWPTQRNALAGSTRSQPSKNNNNNSNSNNHNAAASKNNNAEAALIQPQNGMSSRPKEEEEEQQQTHQSNSDVVSNRVKEEMEIMEDADKHIDELELENNNNLEENNNMNNGEFSDGSVLGYKPSLCEDFFAELGEIEADPLNLLFTQGFNEQQQQQRESKALDPFHLFDWSSSSGDHNTTTTTATSFEEPKR